MLQQTNRRRSFVAAFLFVGTAANAAVSFEVSFLDPSALYASYYTDLRNGVVAAGNDWVSRFNLVHSTTLSVQIGFANIATGNGASATSVFAGTVGGINIFEEGASAELRSGIDPNGAAPDILFNFGINGYLQNELWFDPNPVAQSLPVPTNKTDARSVFLHEFGHALGFNGWRDATSGTLPGNYASKFDALSVMNPAATGGSTITFNGAAAMARYGGAVPLTFGNYGHVGNIAPRAGSELIGVDGDLMNGIVFYRGVRYQISDLNLAMMQDMGFQLSAVPELGSSWLMLFGMTALGGLRLARRRREPLLAATSRRRLSLPIKLPR